MIPMSDARPTLPSVRDLFRDELSRSPRPPVNPSPPWIVPGPRFSQIFDRSFPRAERRQDPQLDGPSVQYSTPSAAYYSHPTQHRHDEPIRPHSSPPDKSSSYSSPHHSQLPSKHHARSSDQYPPSHDHRTPPGSRSYSNYLPTQTCIYSYTTTGISSRGSGSYSDRNQYREPAITPATSETRQPSMSSSLKYECEYCRKGFTRPSSLKIHLNSHTGEKPFVCTFDGCGRSFSVLSNMRRHARVHDEALSRHQDSSSDEHSDRQ